MKKVFVNILAVTTLFLVLPTVVSAHQPRFINENNQTIIVKNPEISQAFYGKLIGLPATFQVSSKTPFNLYVNLLVPDLPGARTDFVMDIYSTGTNNTYFPLSLSENQIIQKLKSNNWYKYFEEFARDDYLKGPEFEKVVPAGDYSLVLSNPQNKGKYVVAIGKVESFPLEKMPETFEQLIKVKVNTFNKPWYSAFLNIFGAAILGIVLIIALIIFILRKLLLKRKRSK